MAKKSKQEIPTLSKYFTNNSPSFFDEINTQNNIIENFAGITEESFDGCLQNTGFLEETVRENDCQANEAIYNFWKLPVTETGLPPTPTMPGVLLSHDLIDPIRTVVLEYLGKAEEMQRTSLKASDVTQDDRGLRKLIAGGFYRSAVDLTGKLLTIYGQGFGRLGHPTKHSPNSLQLWFTRFTMLIMIGQYDILQLEAEPFGLLDNADMFYNYYPEIHPNKSGSMASFSFRLLLAEIPLYTGSPSDAMNRLEELFECCEDIEKHFQNEIHAYEIWKNRKNRVLHSIINCAILMKNYDLVDYILQKFIDEKDIKQEKKRSLLSAWGRIYLQFGDVFGAENKFAEARRLKEMNSKLDFRDFIDKGLLAVARNDFQEAYKNFNEALAFDEQNTMILNNMSVCLLYSEKLKDAISLLEKSINMNPQKSLNESLLINLSTLYELESCNSKNKKLKLLALINRSKPDLNINVNYCLKLQTNS